MQSPPSSVSTRLLTLVGSFLRVDTFGFLRTFSITSMPPVQSATSMTYERPSSGKINLTSLWRSSEEGVCEWDGWLRGLRPTVNPFAGGEVEPGDDPL